MLRFLILPLSFLWLLLGASQCTPFRSAISNRTGKNIKLSVHLKDGTRVEGELPSGELLNLTEQPTALVSIDYNSNNMACRVGQSGWGKTKLMREGGKTIFELSGC